MSLFYQLSNSFQVVEVNETENPGQGFASSFAEFPHVPFVRFYEGSAAKLDSGQNLRHIAQNNHLNYTSFQTYYDYVLSFDIFICLYKLIALSLSWSMILCWASDWSFLFTDSPTCRCFTGWALSFLARMSLRRSAFFPGWNRQIYI